MIKRYLLVLILLLCTYGIVLAQERPLTVFCAADLRYAMDEVVAVFKQKHPDAKVETIYGSSGRAYAQIRNNAPYDLYFSANIDYPERLLKDGHGIGKAELYAIGRVVLWQRKGGRLDLSQGMEVLRDPSIRRLAIANPEHAPYGVAGMEALKTHGMWEDLQSKLVMGENISQAAHFAASGAADVGIIAYSLALAPEMKEIAEPFQLIDAKAHNPLRQGYMITNYGAGHSLSRVFADFVQSKEGKEILKLYGFEAPGQ
ncbi:molybdate ABC transporter substrate-binding protein [Desulfurispira natronophila]|uniref:Molybdate transport system substrate-binding protein n=1 Tax=Desulfurispira natronophila TaxID=682562 RepID=A0A7W7Y5N7_9BACT|nr:molybdate ABC transporter substrate-binding protein [Desulfurispira natronophila]MBB5022272.1 molybdate transport system substrate-binding protein [Desulfurispira natronophila]